MVFLGLLKPFLYLIITKAEIKAMGYDNVCILHGMPFFVNTLS
jgi:hypothetical protein